jgi:hypothetical protein
VDDAGTRLQPFSAQLGIHLARAINFAAEVLLAIVDHLLSALGQGPRSGLLFTLCVAEGGDQDCRTFRSGRLVELLCACRAEACRQRQKRDGKVGGFHLESPTVLHHRIVKDIGFARIAASLLL